MQKKYKFTVPIPDGYSRYFYICNHPVGKGIVCCWKELDTGKYFLEDSKGKKVYIPHSYIDDGKLPGKLRKKLDL